MTNDLAEYGIDDTPPRNGSSHKTPERLLPNALDDEKGVLCSFLNAPRMVGGICVDRQVTKDWFFLPAHSIIFDILLCLWDRNEPIDFIILTQLLRDQGRLEECGGAGYITELFGYIPTAHNVTKYLDTLQEKFQLRRVKAIVTEYDGRCHSEQDRVTGLLDDLERDVLAIRKIRPASTQKSAKQLVIESIGIIEEMYERRGTVTGLPTGFPLLDEMLDGLHASEMVVIAARPSMGKTALAMNIVEHMTVEHHKRVGVFSLEMSSRQLMQRTICSRARVNLKQVQKGNMLERDFPAITVAGSKLAEAKLYIDDQASLTIQDITGRARRWKADHDIQALFIDYLQLIRGTSRRARDNRQLEISEISAGLKALAKELDIALVVLAQLNRMPDQRGASSRPRLSDLRESGSIEQDADTVGFIRQPWMLADDEDERRALMGKAELIIAKQRNGPTGEIPLTFIREYCRFEPRAEADEDQPAAPPAERRFWDR